MEANLNFKNKYEILIAEVRIANFNNWSTSYGRKYEKQHVFPYFFFSLD